MQEKDANRLLERFRAGECTEEEKVRLRNWFHIIDQTLEAHLAPEEVESVGREIWANLEKNTQTPIRKLWPRIAAAAAVLLMIGTAAYLLKEPKQDIKHDVAPFTAKAILRTNGRTIILDQTKNGRIAQAITKSAGETLTYTASETTMVYDTIEIPKGGRPYTVKLSDGSQITLNAGTTLRYPETFPKNNRDGIELIAGEIYAEITHNANWPLTIKAPDQLIQDIGTEFNINAYPDENEKRTTLITGSIAVNRTKIAPGEESILIDHKIEVRAANISQTTAWRKGDFYFKGERIEVIMRQLARWYNIEVVYEGKMTDELFYTQISRKKNISAVLKTLEKTKKVKFKIEGRRVTVSSKS